VLVVAAGTHFDGHELGALLWPARCSLDLAPTEDLTGLAEVAREAADTLVRQRHPGQRPLAVAGDRDRARQVAGLALLVAEVVAEQADVRVQVGDLVMGTMPFVPHVLVALLALL
jgi:hypothetical protein